MEKKKLVFFVIHCTDTPFNRPVSKADIEKWHLSPEEEGGRGWSVVGYTSMVDIHGNLVSLRDNNEDIFVDPWEITNGVKGINGIARHIVYAGGVFNGKKVNTMNAFQEETMLSEVKRIISLNPDILIAGHNQFSIKACPGFDVRLWCQKNLIPQKNIFKGDLKIKL